MSRTNLVKLPTLIYHFRHGGFLGSGLSTLHKPKRPSVFSCPDTDVMSSRPSMDLSSFIDPPTSLRTRAGAVVTSSRRSKRRSSNTAAAQAFAVATAGSASPLAATGIMGFGTTAPRLNFRFTAGTASPTASTLVKPTPSSSTTTAIVGAPPTLNSMTRHSTSSSPSHFTSATTQPGTSGPLISGCSRFAGRNSSVGTNGTSLATQPMNTTSSGGSAIVHLSQAAQTSMDQKKRRSMIMATASCLRVLNVVRHWITKFPDDFDSDPVLKQKMKGLLETLVSCQHLLPNDQRAAGQLLRQMVCDQLVQNRVDLDDILTPTQISSEKNFSTLSALDISEQLTFLDFQIFRSIRSEELLNQSWMKPDKEEKAKHVLLVCKRFNEVSRLVVSEIISRTDLNDRVLCIEKWVAIADICRCLQNYNGVLQICAALVNSSVYRLRRTWERVSKQTKQSIDRLQMLVASDGRFKSMREALHR
ncbi:Ras-specific guanine nucleotide-releasing factor 1 [Paragonimus westermani]|uniref:Ras-specific guanine nucleotide-releasing factor 1 n=1 Tax=Paragonimus westermani TaxID=34504 RepID=A0A5J4NGJ7_9TREM|nr:Ras-specific guanine nucleotide-releasing factor 1 [Paragonimus westermani]